MQIAIFDPRNHSTAANGAQRPRRRSVLSPVPCSLSRAPLRPGISLLEVLISMFVLLFGLMGVAAVFPVGSHYASEGDKYDRDVALVDAAFSELASRGMLQPDKWIYGVSFRRPPYLTNQNLFVSVVSQADDFSQPAAPKRKGSFFVPFPTAANQPHPGYAFVIDPLGTAGGADADFVSGNTNDYQYFPYFDENENEAIGNLPANQQMPADWQPAGVGDDGLSGASWPVRRVTLDINSFPGDASVTPVQNNVYPMPTPVAETIFRLRDDLTVDLPRADDRPGIQPWFIDDANTPTDSTDDLALTRQYRGDYSWIATVVPTTADDLTGSTDALEALQPDHPAYGQKYYDVSVAVIHKRNPAPSAETERAIRAELLPGGQLIIYATTPEAVDAAVDGLRPGRWIALAGVLPGAEYNSLTKITPSQLALKWYRLLALDDETVGPDDDAVVQVHADPQGVNLTTVYSRRLMIDGPDWPELAGQAYIPNLRAFIVPGVIGVTTRSIQMEVPSPWTVQNYPQ